MITVYFYFQNKFSNVPLLFLLVLKKISTLVIYEVSILNISKNGKMAYNLFIFKKRLMRLDERIIYTCKLNNLFK